MSKADDRPRLGYLIDFDPDTDLLASLYEHDESGVRVRVPHPPDWKDKRARWWSHGIMYGDDPDRTKHAYAPPPELLHQDHRGIVGLLGCRSGGVSGQMSGIMQGIINARYAIEGARDPRKFNKINGVRSEIDGLAYWLAQSGIRVSYRESDEGGWEESTSFSHAESIKLAPRGNLKAITSSRSFGDGHMERGYHSRVLVESSGKVSKEWDDHWHLHFAMRNLMRVASWKPINFLAHKVMRSEQTIGSDEDTYPDWCEVRTAATGIGKPLNPNWHDFLFSYHDITKSSRRGITKWLTLSTDYERGINPFVGLLDIKGASIDAHVAQLGIAIEAIGYQSMIDNGTSKAAAKKKSMKERVAYLMLATDGAVDVPQTFADDFPRTYNSVKHADRAKLDFEEQIKNYQCGIRLVRAWIALQLGMTKKELQNSAGW